VYRQQAFIDTGSSREFHEAKSKQQAALQILRQRKLTKRSFEQDIQKDGCRLAPSIDMLRNAWGFEIAGTGTTDDPYWLLDRKQSPTKVQTTETIKQRYYESGHWVAMREARWRHDDYRCVLCVGMCRDELQCHHIRYRLFEESLDELITVCVHHHEMIHDAAFLKFPTGVDLRVAERLLDVIAYEFEEWLLP
jgi:hypothetical protein